MEIVAYAMVVEREGNVYFHDDNLGHCVQVEFIDSEISKIFPLGGYGRTIHHLTDQEIIHQIFSDYSSWGALQRALYKRRKKRRKSSFKKNTASQHRKGSEPYVARMIHNQIQEKFIEHLIDIYGEEHVLREEDFVDVKLLQPSKVTLYVIKPFALAEDCVRAAIGQLLAYLHGDENTREKVIRVVGPNPPTKEERAFIQFIQSRLRVDFDYEAFSMEFD